MKENTLQEILASRLRDDDYTLRQNTGMCSLIRGQYQVDIWAWPGDSAWTSGTSLLIECKGSRGDVRKAVGQVLLYGASAHAPAEVAVAIPEGHKHKGRLNMIADEFGIGLIKVSDNGVREVDNLSTWP